MTKVMIRRNKTSLGGYFVEILRDGCAVSNAWFLSHNRAKSAAGILAKFYLHNGGTGSVKIGPFYHF